MYLTEINTRRTYIGISIKLCLTNTLTLYHTTFEAVTNHDELSGMLLSSWCQNSLHRTSA